MGRPLSVQCWASGFVCSKTTATKAIAATGNFPAKAQSNPLRPQLFWSPNMTPMCGGEISLGETLGVLERAGTVEIALTKVAEPENQ